MSAPANNPDDSLPPLAPGYFADDDDDGDDASSTFICPQEAAGYGLAQNKNGGLYQRGRTYDVAKKLAVSAVIREQGANLNLTEVANKCGVSWGTAKKIWEEMIANDGRIVDPSTVKQGRVEGPGANSFTEVDHFVLMYLYFEEPSRSNASYVENLHSITGTKVDRSTISRWFNDYFPISGRFRKPNMVPIDKFKPINLIKAEEYISILSIVAPNKLRFGDEKLIKGAEVYCRRTRRNVFTGTVPAMVTPPDFRNTYSVYGMCGICENTPPLYWRIHDGNNDSAEFSYDIESACVLGYLRQGDVLVLDNAAIHAGRDNAYLEDFIWRKFEVFILFLPTRAPEWNPQELVWNFMGQKMQTYPLRQLREESITHSTARVADACLKDVTHELVASFFRKSEVI